MKKIPLSGKVGEGKFALVSDEDYEEVSKHRWFLTDRRVATNIRDSEGVYRKVAMHRLIMKPKRSEVVDHIDRDILNNTRENLRVCTQRENTFNRPASKGNSNYKGVSFSKHHQKYAAYISKDRARRHIGYFDNEIDAARAYDYFAEKLFKEYAFLNFPELDRMPPAKRETTSMYRGIYYCKRDRRFTGRFHHNKKRYAIGYYISEDEAVRAFNKKVVEILGDEAYLKLIPTEEGNHDG